jgi:response regulator RpfG family c-di-GMP phosphodiesterase
MVLDKGLGPAFKCPRHFDMLTNTQSPGGKASLHTILIVDDEEAVLVAMRATLQREGYAVVPCSNAVDALKLLAEQPFAVIISDQHMPAITGLEFLSQAKEIQPDATRILITAVMSLGTVIDAINKGEIYRFIVKPWLREDLLATVRNAVQRHDLICKNLILQATTRSMNERLTKLNKVLEDQMSELGRRNQELERYTGVISNGLLRSAEIAARVLAVSHPALAGQARRVFDLCMEMAAQLELPSEQRLILGSSAWYCDVGLAAAPQDLAARWKSSPNTLTPEERRLYENHPVASQDLAALPEDLSAVGVVIRAHHERYDGNGFPDRLRGDEIPRLARLLAVAVFQAESLLDHESTMGEIERGSGTAFDPEAVRVFLRCFGGRGAKP